MPLSEGTASRLLEQVKPILYKIVPELQQAEQNGIDPMTVKLTEEQIKQIKLVFSEEVLEEIKKHKLANLDSTKTLKEVFYYYFGMGENWHFSRNLLGMFLVQLPEYPSYLIPSYTQAKATGNATILKKTEGIRGVFTGCLEGIAVGALFSGERLKPKEMVPFIALGIAMQYISSKVFPFIAEKVGKRVYESNLKTGADVSFTGLPKRPELIKKQTTPGQIFTYSSQINFKGNLKI